MRESRESPTSQKIGFATWITQHLDKRGYPNWPALLPVNNPLQKRGLAVAARRGRNKAAVAVARKLCVAVWHVMERHVIGAIERMDTLHTKLWELATGLGLPAIKTLGYETKEAFVQKKLYLLKSYP